MQALSPVGSRGYGKGSLAGWLWGPGEIFKGLSSRSRIQQDAGWVQGRGPGGLPELWETTVVLQRVPGVLNVYIYIYIYIHTYIYIYIYIFVYRGNTGMM